METVGLKQCKALLSKTLATRKPHSRTDIKGHKCGLCGMSFTRKSKLIIHNRTHTGEKPYDCKSCPRKFSCKYNLDRHTRRHTGEKPYKCEHCPKLFGNTSSLKRHTRTHTGGKPFECRFCDYSSARNVMVTNHERTHTGEKPFQCQLCSFATSHKVCLKNHEKQHSAETRPASTRKYVCPHCRKVYSSSGSLNYHKQTHLREKRHQCLFCDYSAIKRRTIIKHEQAWHAATENKSSSRELCPVTNEESTSILLPAVGVQHFKLTGTPPVLCNICEFRARNAATLAFHMNAFHKLPVVALGRLRMSICT